MERGKVDEGEPPTNPIAQQQKRANSEQSPTKEHSRKCVVTSVRVMDSLENELRSEAESVSNGHNSSERDSHLKHMTLVRKNHPEK